MSGFLLDTNVISELTKINPERKVIRWVEKADERQLFLSVLTVGEIRKGIALQPSSAKRTRLEAWLSEDLLTRFDDRILPVSLGAAELWGELTANLQKKGRALPFIDGLLSATALHHTLTLVTRNAMDVAATGVAVLNPWA